MALRCAALAAAVLLLAFGAACWLRRAVLPVLKEWRPLVLEPEGLQARVVAATAGDRRLQASEIDSFERDGFLVVRGVLPDKSLLQELHPLLRQHQQITDAVYRWSWLYNGAVRAVLRAGILTEFLAALTKSPYQLDEAPIWGSDGSWEENGETKRFGMSAWHSDLTSDMVGVSSVISVWLAITDAPHALEFIRGTRTAETRFDLFRQCNLSWKFGMRGERILSPACVGRVAKERLAWHDLEAGDAVFFHGNMVHRGMRWPRPRLALSVRVSVPERPNPGHIDFLRHLCNENYAAFFPSAARELPRGDPFACIREVLLARPNGVLGMEDRLPPERDLGAAARLFRRVVASLEGAVLSV